MFGKYSLTTFGCKVNQYESQQIRQLIESFGLRPARGHETADIAIINTCAVTASASRKNRQAIRRAARGGKTPVVVVGCGATADAVQLRQLTGVAAVLGHDTEVGSSLHEILSDRLGFQFEKPVPAAKSAAGPLRQRPVAREEDLWMNPDCPTSERCVSAVRSRTKPPMIIPTPLPIVKNDGALIARIGHFAGRQRAYLKVQDGCDAYCTYCIIPQLRPNPRSKPVSVAVEEASDLVRSGHKEIIVTGIFLGAYGRETALRKRFTSRHAPLAELVDALARVEGLERIRLSSLEPGDVGDELLEVLADRPCCVPHLHLPLQSGSAGILRRMNRQYSTDDFVDMIDRVRDALDRPAISTDMIVGFPGETDADFEASLSIARLAGFCKIHAFPFSPRSKTAAARWQSEFVPETVVRERMRRLAEVERECDLRFRRRFIGECERVIVETRKSNENDARNRTFTAVGRADRYFRIHFDAEDEIGPGSVATVRIDRVTPTRTHGTRIRASADTYPLYVLAS